MSGPRLHLPFLLLLAITLLSCLPAVDAAFVYDEHAGIVDNRVVHPGARFADALQYRYSPDQARPLFFASLLLDADLWGLQPRGLRTTGFLLHLLTGTVLYALLLRSAGGAPAAFAGSALFLLHPLQSESVLYIWGRSEVLSTLFGLAAILLMCRDGDRGHGALLRAGALACMALALASKEEAIAVPLVFGLWWILAEDRPARAAIGRALVLCLPVGLFLLLRGLALGGVGRQVYVRSVFDNVLAQGVAHLTMIRLLFVPTGQSIDHDVRIPGLAIGAPAVAACAGMVVAAAIGALPWRPRWMRRVSAGVLIAAAGSALYWLVPLPDILCERRAYLPLAGLALSLAAVVSRLRRRAWLLGWGLVLILAPAMVLRARVWAAPGGPWTEAARLAPGKARPLVNLGVLAAENGERDRALDLFGRALDLEPRNAEALFNRGKLRLDAGQAAEAEVDLEAAVASSPGLVRARVNLAIARIDTGDLAGAESELRSALLLEPGNPRALTNLGEVLRATRRARDAETLYRQALDADPTYAHAAARLGVTLEGRGDLRGALEAYREFLRRGTASATDRAAVEEKVRHLETGAGPPP